MKKIQILFLLLLCCSLNAQLSKKTWDFPVKPGSQTWKSLKSQPEMVKVCQIPIDTLHLLSTKELISICLDYPLLFSLTAFNNMQEGFEQVFREFNGFGELYQRKDFGNELLTLYQSINPEDVNLISGDLDKGRFKFRIFYLEFMLAQKSVFSILNDEELNKLLIESTNKVQQKKNASYSDFQARTTYLLMGRIMDFKKYDGFVKKISSNPILYNTFLNTVFLEDISVLNEIGKSAFDLINNQ